MVAIMKIMMIPVILLAPLIIAASPSEPVVSQVPSGVSEKHFALRCEDFRYREEAELVFKHYGALGLDLSHLDGDRDGRPCESIPSITRLNSVIGRMEDDAGG